VTLILLDVLTKCIHQDKALSHSSNLQLFLRTHLNATERHLPYGITQCYVPPDTGKHAPP